MRPTKRNDKSITIVVTNVFRRRGEIREKLLQIIEEFRKKGAARPDKAMTAEELGLPPRFEDAMKRRLGRIGIFAEVNGKYYLSEERLKEVQERISSRKH
jgi:hypothetical protein